jgi:hypothetical protein
MFTTSKQWLYIRLTRVSNEVLYCPLQLHGVHLYQVIHLPGVMCHVTGSSVLKMAVKDATRGHSHSRAGHP